MSKLNRTKVLATAKSNLDAHKQVLKDIDAENTTVLTNYLAALQVAVPGGVSAMRRVERVKIKTMVDRVKKYEDAIVKLDHLGEDLLDEQEWLWLLTAPSTVAQASDINIFLQTEEL